MQSEMMVVDSLQIEGLHVRLEFLTLPHLLSTNTKTNIEYFERRLARVSGSNVCSNVCSYVCNNVCSNVCSNVCDNVGSNVCSYVVTYLQMCINVWGNVCKCV